MKLTKAQKRVMTALSKGGIVRRRGAFGTTRAPLSDVGFAHSRTIDILWTRGLIRPAAGWGCFEKVPHE